MPPASILTGAPACSRCRQKKINCDRATPLCRACDKASANCSYPSTNARYAISRVRSCTECRRQRARCDRKRPCSSCVSSQVECLYTNRESLGVTDPQSPAAIITNSTSALDFQNSSILLASDPLAADVTSLHPSIPRIWLLWRTYTENVDPLYKIFHAPSFETQLLRGVQDLHAVDEDVETLLFAAYFAGIVSLTNEECLDRYNEAKLVLLKRYCYGLEQCLTRSIFLEKPRLISLQAFVLYITTARDAPMSAPLDVLLALAIRLATKLGIHQDYSQNQQQSLVPITLANKTDTEQRRRLWWHIMTIDVQMAESAGIDPTIMEGTWNARYPENLDDGELDAYSELPLPPRPGEKFDPDRYAMHAAIDSYAATDDQGRRTDMSYALIRVEIFHALRRYIFSEQFCKTNGYEYAFTTTPRVQHLEDLIRKMNTQYLQHCQRNDMFSFFVRNAAKLILSKHLMLAKQTGSTQELLHNCIQVLEAAVGLRKTHVRWAWSLRSYVELDAVDLLLHYLTELRVDSAHGDTEYEAQIQHARALAYAAVERGREHNLSSCYPEQWERIELLQQKMEKDGT